MFNLYTSRMVIVLIIFSMYPSSELFTEERKLGALPLELSDYVTICIEVPETHAEAVREVMARSGAGKIGNYSHCTFSFKGIGRFKPDCGSNPFIGEQGLLEEIVEECIRTVCATNILEHVLDEIKKALPYEEAVIDIYPIYEAGRKKAKP